MRSQRWEEFSVNSIYDKFSISIILAASEQYINGVM